MKLCGVILPVVLILNLSQPMYNDVKYCSEIAMLPEINMSDFDTVLDRFRHAFHRQILR